MSEAPGAPIRVVVADDHGLVRTGIKQVLDNTPDITVVGSARDGAEAIDQARVHNPDVVLMDLMMPNVDGVEATRAIATDPGCKVLVLTSFSDRERIMAALDAGAIGFLLKDGEPEELVQGIRAAARGGSPLDPRVARTLLTARTQREATTGKLTERETGVLRLIARGMPNKLIALELGISEKTVKTHVTSILQSLGVTDRTQAALWAQRNGFD